VYLRLVLAKVIFFKFLPSRDGHSPDDREHGPFESRVVPNLFLGKYQYLFAIVLKMNVPYSGVQLLNIIIQTLFEST
jgi:hypothetical protein